MKLLKSNSVRKVLSNTSWLTIEKLIIMVVSLAVSVYLARELGPSNWGKLNYLLALVGLIGPFTSLGLNAIITRELVNDPSAIDKIMITSLVLRLAAGLLGIALCLVLAILFVGGHTKEFILILMLLLSSVFDSGKVVEFWFQARMENKYVSVMRICLRLLFAAAKILTVGLGGEFWMLVLVFAVEFAALGLGYIGLYYLRGGLLRLHMFDLKYGIALVRQSFWLVLSSIASVIYLKIDQVMLASMQNDAAVGIYAVAVRLSEVWFFFPTAFAAAVFPVLLNTRSGTQTQYQQQLQIVCDILFYGAIALTLCIVMVAPFFVNLLFGSAYNDSAAVLRIHVLGLSLVFMRALVSKWLIAESLLRFSLWAEGIGALTNVGLNLVLIPIYGYWGAAWATVISYVFSCYLCFWAFGETRPIAMIMTRSILLPINWHKSYRRRAPAPAY